MILRKPGVRVFLVAALTATSALGQSTPERPRTLEDWGNTPVAATLCPDPADASGNTLVLAVHNGSSAPLQVTRIELLQVGRVSQHRTFACQPLEGALVGDWELAPGETRRWTFDLRKTTFEYLEKKGSAPAAEIVRKIKKSDLELSVNVLHTSPRWPSGYTNVVSYRPGESRCPQRPPETKGNSSR